MTNEQIIALVRSTAKPNTYDTRIDSFTVEKAIEAGFKLIDASPTTSARLIGHGMTLWLRDGGGSTSIEIRECTADKIVSYTDKQTNVKQEFPIKKGTRVAYLVD
jgi:hypothetical protein